MTPARTHLSLVGEGSYAAKMNIGGFEKWLRSWSAADRTVKDRTIVIASGLRRWGNPATTTPEVLTAWLSSVEFSPWTRVTYYYHLRSYFGWLYDTGQIPTDPTADLRAPRPPKNKPRPLTPGELAMVLPPATGNLRAWLLLGLLAGLRAHEIAKLRGEDIDADAIFVLGKGRQQAFIPTHPDLWLLAQGYPRRGWWFPTTRAASGHVSSQSISTIVTRYFSALGVEGSIHRCRHSYATQLIRNGANIRVVQTLLRHESLATTAKYAAVDEDERELAVRGLASWAAPHAA